MALLIVGLAVFLAPHVFTTFRDARSQALARLGAGPYKGLHALVSLVGLYLLVRGYGQYRDGGAIVVWSPPFWTRHIAIPLMWLSFVALAAAYCGRGMIAGWLRHPMLVGVKIWALAHLLVRGDLGSIVLFGALLAFAVYDRIAVKRRGDLGAPRSSFNRADVAALAVGTIAWLAMAFYLHRLLIGVAPLGV
jgi:uncharacterized membrane protein